MENAPAPIASVAMPEWVSRFFGSLYAAAGMPWPQEKKNAVSAALVQVLDLSPGQVVLDQCCGEGHLSLALAQKGLRVYGVDQSQEYIDRANAMKAGEDAHFFAQDASTWQPPELVDAAVSWHTSIGYGGQDGAKALLGAMRGALRPGGLWLLELRNLNHYKQYHPVSFAEMADVPGWGKVVVERFGQWEDNDLVQHWVIRQNGEVIWEQANTRCWHPSIEQVHALVEELGDECLGVFSDVHRGVLLDTSPRMVVLARKR